MMPLSGLLHMSSGALALNQPSLQEECLCAVINKQHCRLECLSATEKNLVKSVIPQHRDLKQCLPRRLIPEE